MNRDKKLEILYENILNKNEEITEIERQFLNKYPEISLNYMGEDEEGASGNRSLEGEKLISFLKYSVFSDNTELFDVILKFWLEDNLSRQQVNKRLESLYNVRLYDRDDY